MAIKKSSFKISESTISMLLGALVVFVVGILVYDYFTKINRSRKEKSQTQVKEEEKETSLAVEVKEEKNQQSFPKKYKVVSGDHLWKIAENVYQNGYNWVEIARENKLVNPDLIFPGQELTLPKVEIKKGTIGTEGSKTTGVSAITADKYTVVRGDNLWNISIRACGDGFKWSKIAQINNLANPNLIHQGNILKISCQ